MFISLNGKQTFVFLLGAVVGASIVGGWVSWTSSGKLARLAEKLEIAVDGQTRIIAELNAMRGESRHAAVDGSMMGVTAAAIPPHLGVMPNARGEGLSMPGIDSEKTSDKITPSMAAAPSDHEAEQVAQIFKKLRSKSSDGYSGLSSLMSSPEMASLSLANKNKVMSEISHMLDNGELDAAVFFPRQ